MKRNVLEYLEETVKKYPDKPAFVDEKRAMTFQEMYSEARAIGACIIKHQLLKSPVIVFMEKSPETIAAFMGVLYSGNFYCPIDTAMPLDRIHTIIETLHPSAIIVDEKSTKYIEKLNFMGAVILYKDAIQIKFDESTINKVWKSTLDTDPAYILFTSGSTGIPKGVTICHRGIIDFTDWMSEKFNVCSSDKFGNQSPFFFDLSIGDVYCTLKNGCTNYIIPQSLFSFPVKLLEYLNEKEINIIFWVPSALCIVANLRALKKVEMKYLDRILFCGEVMPNKQLNVWRKSVPNAVFANLYGPCEAVDACTYYIVNREFADDDVLPIGIPCENTEILVLNEDNQLVQGDEIGELCIRGTSLALGYYNNPEKTAESFVQNPLNNNYPERIYRTGDLVKYNEYGELMYVSRKDYQIKHMGHRIELGEIENAAGGIEKIETCACIYDDIKKKIVFFYKGIQMESQMISESLEKKIPDYMIPNVIICLREFPYNANGKIDRKRLKGSYLDGTITEFGDI